MSAHIRALFGIFGGGALGYIIAICIAGIPTPLSIGVAVAIVALCVIGIFGCKAVEKDGRRKVERHLIDEYGPQYLALRNDVQEKLFDGMPELLADLKPWPIGDDEVRR